jgi:hypothetical protein
MVYMLSPQLSSPTYGLVCRLQEEQQQFLPPPATRFGSASSLYGGRIYISGGWDRERGLDEFIALDFEQPDERETRLRDELGARLERQRVIMEVHDAMEIKRAWYVELCRRRDEQAREDAERRLMALEDMLSSIPPKTRGPAPTVQWTTAQTALVSWEPVLRDAKMLPLDKESLEYILYVRKAHGGVRLMAVTHHHACA